jgi:peptide/nickel transport system substrate-binding protein
MAMEEAGEPREVARQRRLIEPEILAQGGAMIPMFGDYLDAVSTKLKGVTPHPMFNLMGARIAERVWLEG